MKYFLSLIIGIGFQFAFAQDFDVYVSDAGNFNNPPWQIVKFNMNGDNPEAFINSELNWPQDILFLEDDGVVLISNLGSGRITKHDTNTGVYISNFAAGIAGPTRIKIGPDGLLYVLQWQGNGKVRRYNLDGSYLGEFTSVGVSQSIGIDWDKQGNLYVSSYTGDSVRKFDKEGDDMGLFINSSLQGPTNIWFEENGDLLVSDYDGNAAKRFDNQGNFKSNFLLGLSNSEGVAFLPNGNILIGNGGSSSVKQYRPNGSYVNEFISSGVGNLINPNAVVVRNRILSSVEDKISLTQSIIHPTVGTIFYVDCNYIDKIESISIFSMDGQKVYQSSDLSDILWNGVDSTEGSYIIKVRMNDSKVLTQRVQLIK